MTLGPGHPARNWVRSRGFTRSRNWVRSGGKSLSSARPGVPGRVLHIPLGITLAIGSEMGSFAQNACDGNWVRSRHVLCITWRSPRLGGFSPSSPNRQRASSIVAARTPIADRVGRCGSVRRRESIESTPVQPAESAMAVSHSFRNPPGDEEESPAAFERFEISDESPLYDRHEECYCE